MAHCLCCDIQWHNVFVAMSQCAISSLPGYSGAISLLPGYSGAIFLLPSYSGAIYLLPVTVAQYLCCQVTVAQYLCCQVHVRFRLPRAVHDVHQSPWQPLHQLLPHGSDGTASRNSPVSFGGQVSEPGNCWQTTAGKRWSCWQRTGW